MNSH
jgi:hypothetical protein